MKTNQDQKTWLLHALAKGGSAAADPMAQALQQGSQAGAMPYSQPAPAPQSTLGAQTQQNATQVAAQHSGAQDAFLKALEMSQPIALRRVDAKYDAEERRLKYERDMKERDRQEQRDLLRRQSLVAAAPVLRQRAEQAQDEVAGIGGGGLTPEAIRYHQQQAADARRRQAEIDALKANLAPANPWNWNDPEREKAIAMQAALDKDIAGIGGGRNYSLDAIDYHAGQLESGERRLSALNPSTEEGRMAALESVLREAGGDPTLGYETNASVLKSLQGPTLKERAEQEKARRIITGEDQRPAKVDVRRTPEYEQVRQTVKNEIAANPEITQDQLAQKLIAADTSPEVIAALMDDLKTAFAT